MTPAGPCPGAREEPASGAKRIGCGRKARLMRRLPGRNRRSRSAVTGERHRKRTAKKRRKETEKTFDSILTIPSGRGIIMPPCGCSLVVKRQLPKLELGVRFPPSAEKDDRRGHVPERFFLPGRFVRVLRAQRPSDPQNEKSTVPYREQWIYVLIGPVPRPSSMS